MLKMAIDIWWKLEYLNFYPLPKLDSVHNSIAKISPSNITLTEIDICQISATEDNPREGTLFMGPLCETETSYNSFFSQDDIFRLDIEQPLELGTYYYRQNTTTREWLQWRDGAWSTNVVWYVSF